MHLFFTTGPTNFREMCSFRESKILRHLSDPQLYEKIANFVKHQLIRVYPEGSRISSSNYNPMLMWNCGIQMVALNYQTKDKPMQLNHAKFRQNGNCGYVLMPEYMHSKFFDPFARPSNLEPFSPITLTVKVGRLECANALLQPFYFVDYLRKEFEKEHQRRSKPFRGSGSAGHHF